MEIVSHSPLQTKKIARFLANEVRRLRGAQVVAAEGNLGSGKTTFIQGFAVALGVKEKITSPTFVFMKVYKIRRALGVKHLVHIDCYRLDAPRELLRLGLGDFLKDPDAIILIEWAERIKKLLPRNTLWIRFKHGKNPHERVLIFH